MRSLTGVGKGWRNAEYRTDTLANSDEEGRKNVSVIEREEFKAGRDFSWLTEQQHAKMMSTAQANWAGSGYVVLPDARVTEAEDIGRNCD